MPPGLGRPELKICVFLKYQKGERSLTNIILCGDPGEKSVTQALLDALPLYGGVCFVSPENVSESGASAEFLLCECPSVPRIGFSRGILLLKNGLRPQQQPVLVPEGFCCVLESQNRSGADLLKGSGAVVVACGTGTKDTLSIAGLESAGATISLQRNLVTLNGRMLEPHDFNVTFSVPRSPYQTLLVSAALLLAGVDSQNGYLI